VLAAFATWYARTASHRRIVWQGKKEDNANDMVSRGSKFPAEGRMDFIEQHLGAEFPDAPAMPWLADPYITGDTGNQVGRLSYTPRPVSWDGIPVRWYGSTITALAEGGDQVRQETPSLSICDEAAFQVSFEAAWTAILPAIRGAVGDTDGRAGKVLAASSINQGFFVDGCLSGRAGSGDDLDPPWTNIPPESIRGIFPGGVLPKGMRCRTTPDGIMVLECHYSADPAKDPDTVEGKAWVAAQSKGYVGGTESTAWKREMEIDYDAKGGNPVYPFLSNPESPIWTPPEAWQIMRQSYQIIRAAGYDYGSTNPAALEIGAKDRHGCIYSEGEIYEPCDVLGEHCAKIREHPQFPKLSAIWADASMWWENQRDKRGNKTSLAKMYAEEGVTLSMANRGVDVPVALMIRNKYWADVWDPRMFIDKELNPWLAKELTGLRWKEYPSAVTAARNNNPEEIVQKDNHAADAWFYLMDKFRSSVPVRVVAPPPGTYGYADREHDRWITDQTKVREAVLCQ